MSDTGNCAECGKPVDFEGDWHRENASRSVWHLDCWKAELAERAGCPHGNERDECRDCAEEPRKPPFPRSYLAAQEQVAFWLGAGDVLNAIETSGWSVDELWMYLNQEARVRELVRRGGSKA